MYACNGRLEFEFWVLTTRVAKWTAGDTTRRCGSSRYLRQIACDWVRDGARDQGSWADAVQGVTYRPEVSVAHRVDVVHLDGTSLTWSHDSAVAIVGNIEMRKK